MNTNIKILTVYHRPAPLLSSDIFVPVHGGRKSFLNSNTSKNEKIWMLANTIGDDTGDNISELNYKYNEMSVLYWAWKNYNSIGNPEYIGFQHYRRHFMFKDWTKLQDGKWAFPIDYDTDSYLDTLNIENLPRYINKYDLFYAKAEPKDTVYEQYSKGAMHLISDLDSVLQIIKESDHTAIKNAAEKYINGKVNYFANMFIFKKETFFEYCEWIFPILKKFDQRRKTDYYSYEELRFFVSERLTGIFIQYLIDKGIRHCPLPITMVSFPESSEVPKPAFGENNIPVVFAVDDNYAPYLSVALISLLKNTDKGHNYDIIILNSRLSENHKYKFQEIVNQYNDCRNLSIRFFNIEHFLSPSVKDLFFTAIRVSMETYYRFFISDIFYHYDKIIYLDSDILVNHDISDLYTIDIKDNWLGATLDIRETIPVKLNTKRGDKNWAEYVQKDLGLDNPYKYFQAGVLIFNIKEFIKNNIKSKLLDALERIKTPYLSDQDILNTVCYRHIHFIPVNWNIEWQIAFEYPDYRKIIPADYYEYYQKALNNPYIIHYASGIKPWKDASKPFSKLWWDIAKESPYYYQLLINKENTNIYSSDSYHSLAKGAKLALKPKVWRYSILSKITFGNLKRKTKAQFKKYKTLMSQL